LCLILTGCETQLYGNLSEAEANAVIAALLDSSVPAAKRPGEEGVYTVFVDEADFARAMAILDSAALPQKRYSDLGNVFGGEAMFSTPMEEKARYLHAMQEELSNTVSKIDGVLTARVHLVLPEQDQLGRELYSPSAAVMVRHVDDERHDPVGHDADIKRLVAASVPNLAADRIVVTFFPVAPQGRAAPPPFRNVLGMRVAGESAPRLWAVLGGMGALCLACACAAVYALTRGKKKE
jgi:type III secretion protein J